MSEGAPISKTQRKKDVAALQELGAGLVALNEQQLGGIELPEPLRDAVMEARRITSHEARRRQMQYIGKLMRRVDAAPIRAALDRLQVGPRMQVAAHKRVIAWRERLLAGDAALTELQHEYPLADIEQLRELTRAAVRERETGKPPRHYRKLYQALRTLMEKA